MRYLFFTVILSTVGCTARSTAIKPGALTQGKVEVTTETQLGPHWMEVTMAILDFQNNSPHEDWNYIRATLPDLMAVYFAGKADFKVVERQRLRQVMEELKLGVTGMVDPQTAQRIGKLLGANVVVLGSFTELGNKIILTTRLVKVQTGEVVGGAVEEGNDIVDLRVLVERTSSKILRAFGKANGSTGQ